MGAQKIVSFYKSLKRVPKSIFFFSENQCLVGERIISIENCRDQFISALYSYCFVTAGLSPCLMSPLSMLVSYHRTGQLQPDLPFPSL